MIFETNVLKKLFPKCGDEKENLLQFRLDQEVKKNEELEKENTG